MRTIKLLDTSATDRTLYILGLMEHNIRDTYLNITDNIVDYYIDKLSREFIFTSNVKNKNKVYVDLYFKRNPILLQKFTDIFLDFCVLYVKNEGNKDKFLSNLDMCMNTKYTYFDNEYKCILNCISLNKEHLKRYEENVLHILERCFLIQHKLDLLWSVIHNNYSITSKQIKSSTTYDDILKEEIMKYIMTDLDTFLRDDMHKLYIEFMILLLENLCYCLDLDKSEIVDNYLKCVDSNDDFVLKLCFNIQDMQKDIFCAIFGITTAPQYCIDDNYNFYLSCLCDKVVIKMYLESKDIIGPIKIIDEPNLDYCYEGELSYLQNKFNYYLFDKLVNKFIIFFPIKDIKQFNLLLNLCDSNNLGKVKTDKDVSVVYYDKCTQLREEGSMNPAQNKNRHYFDRLHSNLCVKCGRDLIIDDNFINSLLSSEIHSFNENDTSCNVLLLKMLNIFESDKDYIYNVINKNKNYGHFLLSDVFNKKFIIPIKQNINQNIGKSCDRLNYINILNNINLARAYEFTVRDSSRHIHTKFIGNIRNNIIDYDICRNILSSIIDNITVNVNESTIKLVIQEIMSNMDINRCVTKFIYDNMFYININFDYTYLFNRFLLEGLDVVSSEDKLHKCCVDFIYNCIYDAIKTTREGV